MHSDTAMTALSGTVDRLSDDLVLLRRDIHRNPELSWQETRTTKVVADLLGNAGLRVQLLPVTGCYADVGPTEPAYRVGLRADLDALPLHERTGLPYASRSHGVSHACGHDVHTAALVGAGLACHHNRHLLEEMGLGVRLLFQPAEEVQPSGAHSLLGGPVLRGVDRMFAIHCDPRRDVGQVGLKVGAITAAADAVSVRLRGSGGHTSRPHLTSDLTYALAKVITEVPGALSRRVDPRAGVALVWGSVHAGSVPNVIPDRAEAHGTCRVLDATAWEGIQVLIRQLVEGVVAPYGAIAEVEYAQGVPPVINTAAGVEAMRSAVRSMLGPDAVGGTEQSLGGEDFAWLLQRADGALARLGTRTPGGRSYDLHQGDFVVDERAIAMGAKVLAGVTVAAWRQARSAAGSMAKMDGPVAGPAAQDGGGPAQDGGGRTVPAASVSGERGRSGPPLG